MLLQLPFLYSRIIPYTTLVFVTFLFLLKEAQTRVIPDPLINYTDDNNYNHNSSLITLQQSSIIKVPNSNYDYDNDYERFFSFITMHNNRTRTTIHRAIKTSKDLPHASSQSHKHQLEYTSTGVKSKPNTKNDVPKYFYTPNELANETNFQVFSKVNTSDSEIKSNSEQDNSESDEETDERLYTGLLKSDTEVTDLEDDDDTGYRFFKTGIPNFLENENDNPAGKTETKSKSNSIIPFHKLRRSIKSRFSTIPKNHTSSFNSRDEAWASKNISNTTSLALSENFFYLKNNLHSKGRSSSPFDIQTKTRRESVVIDIENESDEAPSGASYKVGNPRTTNKRTLKSATNKLNPVKISQAKSKHNIPYKNLQNSSKSHALTRNRRIQPDYRPPDMRTTKSCSSKPKVNEISNKTGKLGRSKRQVDLNMFYINQDQKEGSSFHVVPTCGQNQHRKETRTKPLQCYQCESFAADKEPRCDAALWAHLSKNEKHYLKIRCPETKGHYCVKSVSQKRDTRVRTVRGCFGVGPVRTKVGKHIKLRNGCMTFNDGEFLTTSCFCSSDLCNCSPPMRRGRDGSFISLLIVCWALLLYAVCYSFISR